MTHKETPRHAAKMLHLLIAISRERDRAQIRDQRSDAASATESFPKLEVVKDSALVMGRNNLNQKTTLSYVLQTNWINNNMNYWQKRIPNNKYRSSSR